MSAMRPILWMMALAVLAMPALAQEQASPPDVLVVVDTNLPEGVLFADDDQLGPARLGTFRVPAETELLRLVPPEIGGWTITPVERALVAQPGDTVAVALRVPYHYRIESLPFGATVVHETAEGRRVLGETPLLHASDVPLTGTLVAERAGYLAEEIEPGRAVWNRHLVTLEPVEPLAEQTTNQIDWTPPSSQRRWIDYAAVGTALAAGVVAIHYKFKADRRYDRYLETGDPALRDGFERYDLYSGIALGTMQVGVGVFAIRLALR